jgi:MFS family permease
MRRPGLGLLVVGIGALAASLDTSVNIALPAITAAFGLELAEIRWVVIAYVLTYAGLMLGAGKLGDLYGYRRIFRLGLAISAAGFVACTIAPGYGWLLAGRLLQGLGVALTLACAPALATLLYDESGRTWALGAYGSLAALGSALGPIVGGLLVERWGWSAVFAFRAPLVLAALALSVLLPAGRASGEAGRAFDAPGALLLAAAMSAGLLALAAPPGPHAALAVIGLAALAIASFAGFCLRESRIAEPILRLSLFRDGDFALLNLASIAVNLASFGVLLLVPYFIARILGIGAGPGGMILALSAMGTVIGSWLAGRIAGSLGVRRIALAGSVLCAAGLAAIGIWDHSPPLGLVAATMLVHGLGLGLFQVAYTDLVTATLPVRDRGVAGSLAMVTRTIGIVGGAAGLSALHAYLSAGRVGGADAVFLAAFQGTFLFAAAALAALLALTLVLRPGAWLAR